MTSSDDRGANRTAFGDGGVEGDRSEVGGASLSGRTSTMIGVACRVADGIVSSDVCLGGRGASDVAVIDDKAEQWQ